MLQSEGRIIGLTTNATFGPESTAGGVDAVDFDAFAAAAGDDEADNFVALLDAFDVGALVFVFAGGR